MGKSRDSSDGSVEPHVLRQQQRSLHVRNNRLIIGAENKHGTIIENRGVSFALRATVAYINRQRILGSSWPEMHQCVEKHK